MGRYIYKKQWLEKTKIRNNKLVILSTIIYFYIFGNVLHNTVDYPSRCFNNPYMDILCSIIGIILIYNISIKIENSRYSEYIEYFGKSSLGLLGIHFFIIRIIFVGEVIISVSEVSMLKNLIPTGEKYDCFIYTVLVLYIFKKMNDKLSRNRVYSTVFLGKYKGNIIQNNSLKCIITVICVVLMMVVVGTSIPYNKVAATFMQSVDKSKIVLDGQYEDGFVGESAKFYYSSEKARQLDLDIWVTEYTEQNKLTIVNGEEEIQSIDLKSGDNQIVLDIPANINGYIQMKFANTFIPDEIQKNGDKRQLSVVIKKIQIKP